ncbi:MAG: chemotaxis protein CheW [Phormidesmis sp. CAN_BIN36]|nr:chemotaxis protein CheW [Phormidesmis sp. CAN_BIN36]
MGLSLAMPSSPIAGVQEEISSLKAISFTIAGYRLALPMEAVLRVVNCPIELCDLSSPLELVHLGSHAIAVLDLHSHLALKQIKPALGGQQFLVVTRSPQDEHCAIRVDAPPDLVELPLNMIRKLPEPYRNGHPLNIASRVAVLPQGKATLAIFLLDMQRVMDAVTVNN